MVGYWEYTLNKIERREENLVTLDGILANIGKKTKKFNLNEEYSTVRYIDEKEYKEDVFSYIEPEFRDSDTRVLSPSPRFVLFSAPGATGKTALAKHICFTKNGIYWDLPDNKIAEYSFQGAVAKAVGFENISSFVGSMEKGESFLVIDAFDEAEAGSGRSGIEFFLRDLNEVTKKCSETCAILLARTESAIFIKEYLQKNSIIYKHYEVGYFAEYNSKTYIENKLKKSHVDVSPVVKDCIAEQFREIHRIFSENEAKEFLGYAPVLDALAASYSKERNTAILLKNTSSGENNCSLMVKILEDLLLREQDKFLRALKNKFSELDTEIVWEELYKADEQLCRIIGMMLFDDVTIFGEMSSTVPTEYKDEYLEVVNTQLPQHPFVSAKDDAGEIKYEFTGPAFRDYAIAYGLAKWDIADFVNEFLADNYKYCPSQMLVEFYEKFSEKKIKGEYLPLMYNSFKAHAHLGDSVTLKISGEVKECYVEFNLSRNGQEDFQAEFVLKDLEKGVFINQLSNCYIDIVGKVYVGNANGEARINNSTIICDELIWGSDQVLIEAYSPGESLLITNTFGTVLNIVPRFEIKADKRTNLKVSANNIGNYYKLLGYKDNNIFESLDSGFESFAYTVRRIFSCLRSHSKDTPARKMDFIDNRVISTNDKKKEILMFLLHEGILYTDEQDWLYKLNTDKLSEYRIKWNDVRNGEFAPLKVLYNKFCS